MMTGRETIALATHRSAGKGFLNPPDSKGTSSESEASQSKHTLARVGVAVGVGVAVVVVEVRVGEVGVEVVEV